LQPGIEAGPELRLWAAMQDDQYRVRTGTGRLVHIQGNLPYLAVVAVEGRKMRQPRRDEFSESDRSRFAVCPGLQLIGGDVENVGIARLIGGCIAECQTLTLRVETQGADDPSRQLRRNQVLVGAQIEHV